MQRETYDRRLDKVKRDVKTIVGKVKKPLKQLELIDVLQMFGIYHHFKDEIKKTVNDIFNRYNLGIVGGHCRRISTKANTFIIIIDDVVVK